MPAAERAPPCEKSRGVRCGIFLLPHVIADGVYELLPEFPDFHFAETEHVLQFIDGDWRIVGEVF